MAPVSPTPVNRKQNVYLTLPKLALILLCMISMLLFFFLSSDDGGVHIPPEVIRPSVQLTSSDGDDHGVDEQHGDDDDGVDRTTPTLTGQPVRPQLMKPASVYDFNPNLEEYPWELDVDQPRYNVSVKAKGSTGTDPSAIAFETNGPKWQGECFYYVENFCVIEGQLTFFRRKAKQRTTGKLRMCTEFSRRSQTIRLKYQTLPLPENGQLPGPLLTNRTAWFLQFWCQDLFHMTLSMMPAWATKQKLFLNNPGSNSFFPHSDPDIFVRIARGKRKNPEDYCNIKFGHPQDWNITRNQKWHGGNYRKVDKQFPFAGNPYWPFYKALTPDPYRLHPLYQADSRNNGSSKIACYEKGVIDKLYIKNTHQSTAAQYVQSQRESMGVFPSRKRECGKYRVTIIDRRGRTRRLTNIPDLVAIANNFTVAGSTSLPFVAQSYALEHITIKEQIQLMSDTDLLIGMHGNGLTWLQFLPPGSVVVEFLHIYYQPYAKLFGHLHLHASNKKNPSYKVNGEQVPIAINTTEFRELLSKSHDFLEGTSCGEARNPLLNLPSVDEPLANLYGDCVPHC